MQALSSLFGAATQSPAIPQPASGPASEGELAADGEERKNEVLMEDQPAGGKKRALRTEEEVSSEEEDFQVSEEDSDEAEWENQAGEPAALPADGLDSFLLETLPIDWLKGLSEADVFALLEEQLHLTYGTITSVRSINSANGNQTGRFMVGFSSEDARIEALTVPLREHEQASPLFQLNMANPSKSTTYIDPSKLYPSNVTCLDLHMPADKIKSKAHEKKLFAFKVVKGVFEQWAESLGTERRPYLYTDIRLPQQGEYLKVLIMVTTT